MSPQSSDEDTAQYKSDWNKANFFVHGKPYIVRQTLDELRYADSHGISIVVCPALFVRV